VSAAGLVAALKVPSPLPNRIVTLLLPALAITRSGTPSPLKSPTASESNTLAERDYRDETPQRVQEGQQLPASNQRSLKTHG
jgi:hypothetical protein